MIQFKSNACYFSPICPLVFFLLFLIFCLLLEYGNIFLLFHFSSLFHFQLYILTQFFLSGCPRDLAGKESTCNAGDTGDAGSIPGSGRSPGRGKLQPTSVLLPEKSHGQRRLAGCNLRDHKNQTRLINSTTTVLRVPDLFTTGLSLPLVLSHSSRVRLYVTPQTAAHH